MSQSGTTNVVRAIGRWSLAALMVNIMVGSGIFGLPSKVASLTGRQSPIAFLMAAVGIAVIAACFAEVASRFRESGGPYLYTKVAFGRLVGLQTGWLNWLSRLASSAANANLLPDYLAEFWPRLREPLPRVTKSEAREELQKEIARQTGQHVNGRGHEGRLSHVWLVRSQPLSPAA